MWSAACDLYHHIFPGLMPGCRKENYGLDEFEAGYDKFLGVDVLLTFKNGMVLTLQEKFLTTRYDTVTVEYYNDPQTKAPGDWFELKAQLYFVGYWNRTDPDAGFRKWILLSWPQMVLQTQLGNIPWQRRGNSRSNAKADFKYVKFDDVPRCCVIASSLDSQQR